MDLCAARAVSKPPLILPKPCASNHFQSLFHCQAQFPVLLKQTRFTSGLIYHVNSSRETTPYDTNKPERDDVVMVEDTHVDDKKENLPNKSEEEDYLRNLSLPLFKFLEENDIKLNYEETYSVLVFGGGSVVALWLASAVVGAVDSVPLLPKVLELIGLGYTLWFSSRYLIFKENRDELVGRVEQIKQQILGSEDD